MKFEQVTGRANQVLRLTESCFVSYNPNPCQGIRILEGDNSSEETALCIDGEYFILNGDFRGQYETAASVDVASCVDVYENNKEFRSSWSSDVDAMTFLGEFLKRVCDED